MNTNDKIIANKSIKGFSINFGEFFYEGQRVDYTDKKGKRYINALIKSVNENANTITVVHNGRTFLQRISAIRIISEFTTENSSPIDIQAVFNKPDDTIFMVKSINGFSFDLCNWFFEGQNVFIVTENNELYTNVFIKSVNSVEKVTIEDFNGKIVTLNLEDIKQIEMIASNRQNMLKMVTYNCS